MSRTAYKPQSFSPLLLSKHAYGSRVPWREHQIAQKTKRVRRAKSDTKHTTPAAAKAPKAPKAPKVPKPAATRIRAKAARRTAEGKFTKIIFNQIGGEECRRFAAMTWKERDAFMAKPENALVRERYEKHMALVKSETTA